MDVLKELERAGAVLLDKHFVYKSGKHGSGYINMDPLFPDTLLMGEIAKHLRDPFIDDRVEVITGPPTGGMLLATFAAMYWPVSQGYRTELVWADKQGDGFAFERAGFADRLNGKKVLVIEDLLTTGGSVNKVCREAEKHDAEIIGVSAVCNRGGVTAADLGVPRLEVLSEVNFEAIDADQCPLCAEDRPIVEDIGHGTEYKSDHPDYSGGYVRLLG